METVSSLLSQLNTVFSEKEQQLEQAEANLKKEAASLTKEKELMARTSPANHDLIHLNVGGTVLTTRRSTLTQAKGSTLAAWFSGRWEHCLDRDNEGHIFLDFDPELFQPILSFLRSSTICSKPDKRSMPLGVPASKKQAFTDLVRYLALEDYLGCVSDTALQPLPASFAKANAEVSFSKHRQKASVSICSQVCGNILLHPPCSSCCYLKFRIISGDMVFVGVWANVAVIDVGTIERSPTCFGFWASAREASPWVVKGRHVDLGIVPSTRAESRRISCLVVRADFTSHQLSIRTAMRTTAFDMPIQMAEDTVSRYSFVMILDHAGDAVQLLPVTPEDQALFP